MRVARFAPVRVRVRACALIGQKLGGVVGVHPRPAGGEGGGAV